MKYRKNRSMKDIKTKFTELLKILTFNFSLFIDLSIDLRKQMKSFPFIFGQFE